MGSQPVACGPPGVIGADVATQPVDFGVEVDGMAYGSPAAFTWDRFSIHEIGVAPSVPIGPEERYEFRGWNDGGNATHYITAPDVDSVYTASFQKQHPVTMEFVGGGGVAPESGWFDAGIALSIEAIPLPGFTFEGWSGEGEGSYSGLDNPALVTPGGAITQTAMFAPIGWELSISASSTDPDVTQSRATGELRSLYLWLECSNGGVAAIQAMVTGTLDPMLFTPAAGVLNAGDEEELHLAVGGCPLGQEVNFLLGWWLLDDIGGSLCLGPLPGNEWILIADCELPQPNLVVDPGVTGFSSMEDPPCRVGMNYCADDLSAAQVTSSPIRPDAVERTSLHPAFPNPFTRATSIRFSLESPRQLSLTLLDVRGRVVRTLAARDFPAGEHRLSWNGFGRSGAPVAAGVYFVRLEADRETFTRKVVFRGR
jgi:hypothetical protein